MKYPIEIQIFEQIIEDGYVYADKTELVYRLISERAESGKRGLCSGLRRHLEISLNRIQIIKYP